MAAAAIQPNLVAATAVTQAGLPARHEAPFLARRRALTAGASR